MPITIHRRESAVMQKYNVHLILRDGSSPKSKYNFLKEDISKGGG